MGRPVNGSGRVTRDEQAERTRTRILDAAREEFIASGFGGANMADIAERAGVSVQMVYFAFGRKGRLFSAVMQRAVFGDDGVPPPHTEWWRRLGEHPTARDVLREFIERNGPVFAAAAPIAFVVVRGMSWSTASGAPYDASRSPVTSGLPPPPRRSAPAVRRAAPSPIRRAAPARASTRPSRCRSTSDSAG